MMLLVSTTNPKLRQLIIKFPEHWGYFITTKGPTARASLGIDWIQWGCDNDCYTGNFDRDRFLRFLDGLSGYRDTCLFVPAPDVLSNAKATLTLFSEWGKIIKDLGFPVALVAQDGLEDSDVPWQDIDTLFVGGSTDWKLGNAARQLIRQAKARHKWVHVGRVNTRKRLLYCLKEDVDSIDGNGINIAFDKRHGELWGCIQWFKQQLPLPT
jgi:hypothetical protein